MKLSAGDLLSADALVDDYLQDKGATPEYAAGVAWLARGAVMLGDPVAAARYIAKSQSLLTSLSKTTPIEDNPFLIGAQGAVIESEARLLVLQGKRDQAIALLTRELPKWQAWQIRSRIQKNLNLLTLEGTKAPLLDASVQGKPVLLFLWAHWCGDCKAEAPVIAKIREKYEPRGLVVLAPTRRYGSVHDNDQATPEQEDQEIESVWSKTYPGLAGTPHPVQEQMMQRYGVSATPTIVLVDRAGIVRLYRPSRMSESELAQRIEPLLDRTPRP